MCSSMRFQAATSEQLFRVTNHTRIMAPVTGPDTCPVVASERPTDYMIGSVGNRIHEDLNEFVGTRGPNVAYRYRTGPV